MTGSCQLDGTIVEGASLGGDGPHLEVVTQQEKRTHFLQSPFCSDFCPFSDTSRESVEMNINVGGEHFLGKFMAACFTLSWALCPLGSRPQTWKKHCGCRCWGSEGVEGDLVPLGLCREAGRP